MANKSKLTFEYQFIYNIFEKKHLTFWLALIILIGIIVLGYNLSLHTFVPVLGPWEHFTFFHYFGADEAYRTWRISPRAIAVGQGYPLMDFGLWLSQFWGWSTLSIRVVPIGYGIINIILMILVFSRWFGLVPSVIGVLLTATSLGYLFFTVELNVMMPTLLVCTLLLERLQAYDANNKKFSMLIILGIIGATLILHYAMGRFFFIGLLGYFLSKHVLLACLRFPNRNLALELAWTQIFNGLAIVLLSSIILVLLDGSNFFSILDVRELFFPGREEIEFNISNWVETISTNIINIINVFFPPFHISVDRLSINLQNWHRFPILNLWHSPFIIIGFIVSLRRTFQSETSTSFPYATLLAMTFLTLGLALFSAIGAFPITRLIIGFLPLAGFIVVGVAWTFELLLKVKLKIFILGIFAYVFIFAFGVSYLVEVSNTWREKVTERSSINLSEDQFKSFPQDTPNKFIFMQARFKRLANILDPIVECKIKTSPKKVQLVQIAPSIILEGNTYDVIQYLNQYNDISPTLALYFADLGFNTSYMIIYPKDERGIAYLSHSYLGKPRIYSGPIKWENKKIKYIGQRPFNYSLKIPSKSFDQLVIFSFSDEETNIARRFLNKKSLEFSETRVFEGIYNLVKRSESICQFD